MISSARVRWGAVVVLVAVLAPGCADFSRGSSSGADGADGGGVGGQSGGDGGSDGDPAGALSFAATIHPLLLTACQHCHSQGGQAGDTTLLFTGAAPHDYDVVSRFVTPTGSGAGSRLLAKISGNGHGGGTIFSTGTPEYQTVLNWIQQGARP